MAANAESGLAQTGRGTIQGVVRDASKAVVPGAQVVLTNTGTNVSQTSQTNEVGLYYFGALQPGPYTLNVEVTGFKKWEGKLELKSGRMLSSMCLWNWVARKLLWK